MSLATLEREIAAAVAVLVCNPKFKPKDICEWTTGDIEPRDDEVVVQVLGLSVALLKTMDKRSL